MAFPEAEVSVTMTGAEWTALLGRIAGYSFSASGRSIYRSAAKKLQEQLTAASHKNPSTTPAEKMNVFNLKGEPVDEETIMTSSLP